MSEGSAFVLPGWMRVVAIGFALVFGSLSFWLAERAAEVLTLEATGAVLAGILAVVLLLGAIRGRLWKWVWFVPGW